MIILMPLIMSMIFVYNIQFISYSNGSRVLCICAALSVVLSISAVTACARWKHVSVKTVLLGELVDIIKPIPLFLIQVVIILFLIVTQYAYAGVGDLNNSFKQYYREKFSDIVIDNAVFIPRSIKEILVGIHDTVELIEERQSEGISKERLSELEELISMKRGDLEDMMDRAKCLPVLLVDLLLLSVVKRLSKVASHIIMLKNIKRA